jgi:hypothetical protein
MMRWAALATGFGVAIASASCYVPSSDPGYAVSKGLIQSFSRGTRDGRIYWATSSSAGGLNFAASEATLTPPSFCYRLQVTNADQEEENVFASIDLPVTVAGESSVRMTLTVELQDSNGDGWATLNGLRPGDGLQRAYLQRWNAANFQDTRLGGQDLGTPLAQPGAYSFELGTTTMVGGPSVPDADTLTGILNVRLSPGDTIQVVGTAVLDDGSGQPACAVPDQL